MFVKFLASQISGWLAVVLLLVSIGGGAFITKQVADYKELQRKAAYCEGQLSAIEQVRKLQERAVDRVEQDEAEALDELEAIRNGETEGPDGCAAERAPESVLRYHGYGVRE